MDRVSARDLRAVLDVVHIMNEDSGEVEISDQVLDRLDTVVGCDSMAFGYVEPATRRIVSEVSWPREVNPRLLPGFDTVFSQHPGFAALRSGRVVPGTSTALSALLDLRALRCLPLYVDYYQPFKINDQIFCAAYHGGRHDWVLTFARSRRGFSRRDHAVVNLMTAHLYQTVAHRERLVALRTAVRNVIRQNNQLDRASSNLAKLTTRERDVIEHLSHGLTDREISRSLAISPRTVHKHLEHIYRKLGLTNRASLLALTQECTTPPVLT
jgi:DNA-binding CsgD family transcriptional regulator